MNFVKSNKNLNLKIVQFIFIISASLVQQVAFAIPSKISGLDLVKGGSVSIELNQSNKATVLIFLSALCPCSKHHVPAINELAQQFGNFGFRFVGIHSNANEEFEISEKYFKNAGLSFPVLQDDQAKIAIQLNAYKTPHVFILSPEGKILFGGGVDNTAVHTASRHYLKDALTAINQGKEPPERVVEVLGCKIKRP